MKKAFICLLLIFNLSAAMPRCFAQSQPLTAEIKKQTIEDLSALLPERYAYKEIGQKLRELLERNLRAGRYDSYTSPTDFSLAVTGDLRSLNSDRHLALNYSPQAPTTSTNNSQPPLSPEEQAKRASAFNRQMNYGFRNLQFFNGNIGYLKFDYFDAYPDYSSSVVDASMTFFKNCDALIIDLRDNGGGGSQMVGYIAGFFFKEKTLSGTSYNRLDDTTTEEFITPQPKEKQLPQMDLYILTSRSTISAAEALAYNLKYLKGAKVIGETSAGAANPGRVTRLNTLFTAFIPNRHGKNIVTGTNWEGTGVPVDVACPAEEALRVARVEALKKLRQQATEPLQRKKFDSYITFLEKRETGKELPERILRQYAGGYQGGRTVALKNGKLYYLGMAEAGGELHFISPDLFMLSEGDVSITFKRDKYNRVVGMEYQWSLVNRPILAAKIK
ncbi:MAG TPA: S41 family peptidase [Pyrinomonadaceae bacterium]|nr:S41 family peptidase [Pyrinomonadaceae bacterium]